MPPEPPAAPLPDHHELVAFDDPAEQRTWIFDVTFLTSSWRCIYGHGCPGVLTGPAPELEQGCCSYGAHVVDDVDLADVLAAAARLRPDQWQNRALGLKRGPVRRIDAGQAMTRLVDDACIFHNRPGFPGGAGCALHRAALEAGERPIDWKPDVCWQMPLRLVDATDDSGQVISTLREWKRRDWGEGGAEFHWWCTEEADAYGGHQAVYEALHDEIVELVGPWAHQRFVDYVESRPGAPDRTERTLVLPVRRRA